MEAAKRRAEAAQAAADAKRAAEAPVEFMPYEWFFWRSNYQSTECCLKAFRDDPKTSANALVLEKGSVYSGSCWPNPGGSPCSAGSEIDTLCRDATQDPLFKNPPPVYAKTSRRLYSSSCHDKYRPWFLVQFTLEGETIKRCAWRFGTFANSDTSPKETDTFMKKTNGSSMEVWMQNSLDHCVVGFDALRTYVNKVEANMPFAIGFGVISVGVAVIAFGCAGFTIWKHLTEWRRKQHQRLQQEDEDANDVSS